MKARETQALRDKLCKYRGLLERANAGGLTEEETAELVAAVKALGLRPDEVESHAAALKDKATTNAKADRAIVLEKELADDVRPR